MSSSGKTVPKSLTWKYSYVPHLYLNEFQQTLPVVVTIVVTDAHIMVTNLHVFVSLGWKGADITMYLLKLVNEIGRGGMEMLEPQVFCDFCRWFQWRKNLSSDFGQSNSVKLFRQGQMEIYCSCSLSWENKTQDGLGLCFVIGFFSTCILIFL